MTCNDPAEVTPFLFIASGHGVKDLSVLKKRCIVGVVNASNGAVPCAFRDDLDYLELSLKDTAEERQILMDFTTERVFKFINERKEKGGATVVHCLGGVSRSACLVIAYLMAHESMSLRQAFETVKAARPQISPNEGFFDQLIAFERRCHGNDIECSFTREAYWNSLLQSWNFCNDEKNLRLIDELGDFQAVLAHLLRERYEK